MSTILIADDEARIRRLVSDFLKRDGHTILEAADGKTALELIENRRPTLDLAILDVMMPGMDGFEVLREVREQETGDNHLPVMLLTARAEDARPGARSGGRRGRLRDQALLPHRARRPRAHPAQARGTRGFPHRNHRLPVGQRAAARGARRGSAGRAHPQGVRAAHLFQEEAARSPSPARAS